MCSASKEEEPILPTRVIDVGDETTEPLLLDGNGKRAPYLALSYCSGSSENIKTTKQSFLERSTAILLDSLPPTFHDAVLATRELGFKFLWIDCICIVQDDEDDWNREVANIQHVFANAAITLSALESDDTNGGLFRPRSDCVTSPVQISIRVPKQFRGIEFSPVHQTCFFVLPVQGEKQLFKPGPMQSRAWTLQEQVLSTRIIHYGPGILYWECLSCHGSEADPEGRTHPYNSSCTNFMVVRKHKRIVHGHAREGEGPSRVYGHHGSTKDDDSDDDVSDQDDSEDVEQMSNEEPESDEEQVSDDQASSVEEEAEDLDDESKMDSKAIAYLEWQELVSEYSSREVTKPAHKITAFLGLSKMVEGVLQDEFAVGLWKKSHFLPSLLWSAHKPGGTSRNKYYPSWTWASIEGSVEYRITSSRISWEPSSFTCNFQVSGPSQNSTKSSISLRSSVKRFPKDYKFWRYENWSGNPMLSSSLARRDWETKSRKKILNELMVVGGFRDLRSASPESKAAGGWEGAGDDIYCVVVARIGKEPPPRFGYPVFIGGRTRSIVCLCLIPVHSEEAEADAEKMVFRRVGWCEFWDVPTFWDSVVKDQWVTII
jgi:hypothetical protein